MTPSLSTTRRSLEGYENLWLGLAVKLGGAVAVWGMQTAEVSEADTSEGKCQRVLGWVFRPPTLSSLNSHLLAPYAQHWPFGKGLLHHTDRANQLEALRPPSTLTSNSKLCLWRKSFAISGLPLRELS